MDNNRLSKERVASYLLKDDGIFPNNSGLPLVIHERAFAFEKILDPGRVETVFAKNNWTGSWRNGLYPFHHYHSTAHEVLGIYLGSVRVQFGGEGGPVAVASAGDVVVIPAGVAHKNLWSSHDFRVVGAYPEGQTWDMNYGKKEERPAADNNIRSVSLPRLDPVLGAEGPLVALWGLG
jgi:uncharacterized protein YjlB